MDDTDEIVAEFVQESRENLDSLDGTLVALEREPGSPQLLAQIFRNVHTIKGTSGFLGFSALEALTHAGENLLALLREGKLALTPGRADALLLMVDSVRAMLTAIEKGAGDASVDASSVVDALRAAVVDGDAEPARSAAEGEGASPAPGAADIGPAETSVRVDVDLLDALVRSVGELVLARNQIVQRVSTASDQQLVQSATRLSAVVGELQEGVMQTRMQPIAHVWSRLPRLVRDVARQCGKQVQLTLQGQDTGLDRTLLEAVKDPLTHLVRNAIDHGIEPPEVRVAAGKVETGSLVLRAAHEGGQVVVEVEDDGAGMDPARLRAKAVEKGLLTAEQAERLTDREAVGLIFRAGFSTAAAVTNISGRGVGMDVVRSNVEALGGSVDVSSVLGRGTTFRVRIPLTLAIVGALIVESGGVRYALPQADLVELVRLRRGGPEVERVGGAPVFRLRDRLLPLVFLHEALGSSGEGAEGDLSIVVLHGNGHTFGLVVDTVHGTEEIVVKPLSSHVGDLSLYSGATVLGDGAVVLIVDVASVGERAQSAQQETVAGIEAQAGAAEGGESGPEVLVVRSGPRKVAVELGEVARLEEFRREQVEEVGGQLAVQYRDGVLPLVDLGQVLGVPSYEGVEGASGRLRVLVAGVGKRGVGLVVDEVEDVAIASRMQPSNSPFARGTAVVAGLLTDVLDLPTVARAALPSYTEEEA